MTTSTYPLPCPPRRDQIRGPLTPHPIGTGDYFPGDKAAGAQS